MPETPPEESRIEGDPNKGNETINAPAGVASLSGFGGGPDWLIGNSYGNRFYIVDPGDKVIEQPGGGVDTMYGWQFLKAAPNVENLVVHNELNNAYGNDLDNLIITDGRAWMYGGKGNDVMVGVNTTTSTYVVRAGEGNDVIYNWAGNSQLQLWDASMKSPADVRSHMTQQGADAILQLSTGETLTFRDTSVSSFLDKQFLLTLDRSKLGALTFGDEFNTLSLYDQSHQTGKWSAVFPNPNPKDIWSYSLPSNGEEEVYVTPGFEGSGDRALEINPFSIDNGVLTITSRHLTPDQQYLTWGRGYASGTINTLDLFEQKYGYFEASIELPTDKQGAWPAFWTIPWPYTGNQEGDIMEALSNKQAYDYRRAYGSDSFLYDNALKVDPAGFHKYGMLWTKDTVTFYYDDVAVLSGPTPSNWTAPMAMILNLATGGNWTGQANPADFPASMKVDYVHVYGLADGSSQVSIQKPATYSGVMLDGGTAGPATSVVFQDTGTAINSSPVVLLNHAPAPADLPGGRAFIVWEDGGAVWGAQSTNGVLDTKTAIIAGTIGQFGAGTFLSDGRMAVTYIQDGNPAKEVWIAIIDPDTHEIDRHELGDGVGGVKIIATPGGGFVASWHTATGAVEGRAYDSFAYDGLGYYAPTRDLPGDVTGITAGGSVLAGGQAFTLTGHQLAPINTQISVSSAQVSHAEGNSGLTTYTFVLNRDFDSWEKSTVAWKVVPYGSNPASPSDFAAGTLPTGVVTFDINKTSATVTVNVVGDTAAEPDEQFQLVLFNPENATLGNTTAVGVITNDEGGTTGPAPAQVDFGTTNAQVNEGSSGVSNVNFTVLRSGATTGTTTVHWAVSGSGANPANAADFWNSVLPQGDLTFAAGETTKTITVAVNADQTPEPNESFTVTLSAAQGGVIGAGTATGQILNDDTAGSTTPPVIAFSTPTVTHAEGASGSTAYTYNIVRTGDASGASTVHWAVSGTSTYPADATDFTGGTLPQGDLSFAAGETTKTITVNVAGDAAVENDEQFTIVLSGATGATLNASASAAAGVITNDDTASGGGGTSGQVFTASGTYSTLTGTGGADTFNGSEAGDTITGGAGGDVFHFAKKPWDPSHITDFQVGSDKLDLSDLLKAVGYTGSDPIADKYIAFADNGAGGTKVLFDRDGAGTAQQWPDRILELDKLAYNPANASQMLLGSTSGGGTTTPPPASPTIALTTTSVTLAEGASGSTAFAYTLTRTGASTGASSVHWAVTGSGTNGASASDFTGGVLPQGDVTFAAGETSKTITVNVAGDTAVETDEAFTVTLSNVSGATLGTATASGVITNDDTASGGGGTSGQVFTASGTYSTLTGTGGADTFNGSEAGDTITGGAGGDVFHFAKKPWDPSHITDFQVGSDKLDLSDLLKAVGYTGSDPIADKYIAFADNGAGGTKVLFDRDGAGTAQQWPDRILELDKLAYNPANASQMLLGSTSGGGTTTPPPASPTIALTTTSVTLAEGASGSTAFAYTLTRTGASTGASSVHWAVTGSGTNGASASDFTGGVLPQGDVTFAAGETSKTITVNVAGDTAVETDEAFTVTLSNVSGATLGTATASGLITNDDTASGGGGGTAGQVYTAPGIRSTMSGTGGNDTFIASEAGDTITGGAGSDLFDFNKKPWDPTHITDFNPSTDKLDLSDLLKAVGYTGSNAVADKYVSWMDNGAGGSKILFDRDGVATAQQWPDRIIELDNLPIATLNAASAGWLIT